MEAFNIGLYFFFLVHYVIYYVLGVFFGIHDFSGFRGYLGAKGFFQGRKGKPFPVDFHKKVGVGIFL